MLLQLLGIATAPLLGFPLNMWEQRFKISVYHIRHLDVFLRVFESDDGLRAILFQLWHTRAAFGDCLTAVRQMSLQLLLAVESRHTGLAILHLTMSCKAAAACEAREMLDPNVVVAHVGVLVK